VEWEGGREAKECGGEGQSAPRRGASRVIRAQHRAKRVCGLRLDVACQWPFVQINLPRSGQRMRHRRVADRAMKTSPRRLGRVALAPFPWPRTHASDRGPGNNYAGGGGGGEREREMLGA
jgi:hypothetical protein